MARPSADQETIIGASIRKERRAATRFSFRVQGDCQPITANEAGNHWPVNTLDISTSGVAVLLSRRFEPGTLLALELSGASNPSAYLPLARVCRVTRNGLHWLLGCVWQDTVATEEIHELVGATAMWEAVRSQIERTSAACRELGVFSPSEAAERPSRKVA